MICNGNHGEIADVSAKICIGGPKDYIQVLALNMTATIIFQILLVIFLVQRCEKIEELSKNIINSFRK